ncbi:hypothetical protein E2C01_069466 [Portunus trituberculatus]|uniref:Uncharacterized protein n=1 Tax=Portunus trituberculatus TaxID=210409 RepID=A0A5B7HQ46_PORTR|nr:hypothetical protein [Portunus trituberculatus]
MRLHLNSHSLTKFTCDVYLSPNTSDYSKFFETHLFVLNA